MSLSRRVLGAGLMACACTLSIPAAGHAAQLFVTSDAGTAVPLNPGATIRHMSPEVKAEFGPEELVRPARYTLTVEGPGGVAVTTPDSCHSARSSSGRRIAYRGNGVYTVRLSVFATASSASDCKTPTQEVSVGLVINAFSAVSLPPQGARLLTRAPNSHSWLTYEFPLDINPGSQRTEVSFARGASLTNGSGPIQGKPRTDSADPGTSHTSVTFFDAGNYTMLSQATSSDGASPYSTPLRFFVQEPFDLSSVSISSTDRPVYRVNAAVRSKHASRRRVVISARRQGAKKFRRLGVTRVTNADRVRMSFRQRKTGRYTLRFRYVGSRLTRAGRVDYPVRITRRAVRVGDPID